MVSLVNEISAIAVMFITIFILLGGDFNYKIFEVSSFPFFNYQTHRNLKSQSKVEI